MKPATLRQLNAHVESLLRRSLPGTRKTVDLHIRRVQHIATQIWKRFPGIGPYQWQVKHLRWGLEHGQPNLSPASRYDYWRSVQKAIVALGRTDDWAPLLRGPWLRPDGTSSPIKTTGRPPRMPGGGS